MKKNKKCFTKAQKGADNKKKRTATSDAFSDLGSRLSNALYTFGGSAVGDAIYGAFGEDAAKAVEYYTGGLIPHTTPEHLQWGREHSAYDNIKGQVAPALASTATISAGGHVVGKSIKKGVPILMKEAESAFPKLFRKKPPATGIRPGMTQKQFKRAADERNMARIEDDVKKYLDIKNNRPPFEKQAINDLYKAKARGETQYMQERANEFTEPLFPAQVIMEGRNQSTVSKAPYIINSMLPVGIGMGYDEDVPELRTGGKKKKIRKLKR